MKQYYSTTNKGPFFWFSSTAVHLAQRHSRVEKFKFVCAHGVTVLDNGSDIAAFCIGKRALPRDYIGWTYRSMALFTCISRFSVVSNSYRKKMQEFRKRARSILRRRGPKFTEIAKSSEIPSVYSHCLSFGRIQFYQGEFGILELTIAAAHRFFGSQ